MGGPSSPKKSHFDKSLRREQRRQLNILTAEENQKAKALQRGRLGLVQLLGPQGALGIERAPVANTAPAIGSLGPTRSSGRGSVRGPRSPRGGRLLDGAVK